MRTRYWCGGLFVVALLLGVGWATAQAVRVRGPATRGVLAAIEAQMERGVALRKALLEAMEESYQNQGVWPQHIGVEEKSVYMRPGTDVNNEALAAGATVVVHESLQAHPQGVWVGYADGHLEFAADDFALRQCMAQIETAKQAAATRDRIKTAATLPATEKPRLGLTAGSMRVKVVDPEGRAVEGAHLGVFRLAGTLEGHEPRVYMLNGDKSEPVVTDAGGEAVLTTRQVFVAKFATQPAAPLWIMHEKRGLAGIEELNWSDFGNEPVRTIRVGPACTVKGRVTSLGLWEAGRPIKRTIVLPALPGKQVMYTFESVWEGVDFEFLMPAGDFQLNVYGTASNSVYRFVHIEPGRREMELSIDLPLQITSELLGKAAPELKQIKGWKNGGPVRLAELKGKVVLLNFWGYWCGPCVGEMPELMKLHDEFHEKGLVVVAVHDDSADSIREMDQKLESVRKSLWNGRDLPFMVALDGGGPTRIVHSARTIRGATTAAYGILSFPTSLLIGRDGKVLCEFEVRAKDAAERLEKALRTGEAVD